MTKRRAPLSIDAALTRIAGQLAGGWDEMAEAVRRRPTLVRSWGDPDRREQIPLRDAIQLDRAFAAAGGNGAPLFEVYASRLGQGGALLPADTARLLAHAATVARECGEAHAATLDALAAGGNAQDDLRRRAAAANEARQAIAALQALLTLLAGPAGALPTQPGADTHPSTGPP